MQSTNTLGLGIEAGQTEDRFMIKNTKYAEAIEKGDPIGINYKRSGGGHYVVGIGYAMTKYGESTGLKKDDFLYLINDPWEGKRQILNRAKIGNIQEYGSWNYTFYQDNHYM